MNESSRPAAGRQNKGYLAAVASALFLSLTAIFIRHLTDTYRLPALILVFWREFFVALSLAGALAIFSRKRLRGARGHIGYLLSYGIIVALFNSTWTFSVALNGAAVATVLAYSSTAFTVLLGWLILKESVSMVKITAVLMSVLGCALVVGAYSRELWSLNALGTLAGIAAGLSYSLYGIMGRIGAKRGLNTWTTLLYIFLFASAFMLAVNLTIGSILPGGAQSAAQMLWLGSAWGGWLMLVGLAVGPTLFGFGLYNVSLRDLPASTANLIVMIEPIFTAVTAFFLFGEVLSPIQIAGAALILGAVFVLRLEK